MKVEFVLDDPVGITSGVMDWDLSRPRIGEEIEFGSGDSASGTFECEVTYIRHYPTAGYVYVGIQTSLVLEGLYNTQEKYRRHVKSCFEHTKAALESRLQNR